MQKSQRRFLFRCLFSEFRLSDASTWSTSQAKLIRAALKYTRRARAYLKQRDLPKKFLFLSGSDLPLKPFAEFYCTLLGNNDSDFCLQSTPLWQSVVKHGQWLVLNRPTAEAFAKEVVNPGRPSRRWCFLLRGRKFSENDIYVGGGWVNCLACADDLLLLAEFEEELIRMYRELFAVCEEVGQEGSGRNSSVSGATSFWVPFVWVEPQPITGFIWALFCGAHCGPPGHRVNMAWTKFWARRAAMCTGALSIRIRLHALRAEVLPVLMRGPPPGICAPRSSVHKWPR